VQAFPVKLLNLRIAIVLTCFIVTSIDSAALADANDRINELSSAAVENRTRLNFDGKEFTGPALERLLAEARNAQFFLIGEEHGIAENPKLAAQLFTSLVDDGYEKLVIEISPPVARSLDQILKNGGIEGLQDLYAMPGGEPAFFGMREEAELLHSARAALPDVQEVFWGIDYEVASDRRLLHQLQNAPRPDSADEPLNALVAASEESWASYAKTGNLAHAFSFSGDPALVRDVKNSWPDPDDEVSLILDTLETTLKINRLWFERRGWESNAMRAGFMRSNFLRHWRNATNQGATPKIMAKLGSSHLVRGINMTGTFDLGSLLPEIAAIEGRRSFSLMVVPGANSDVAVLDPKTWTFSPQPAKDGYSEGIGPITAAAYTDAFTLIDLVPLRPIVSSREKTFGSKMLQIVHGFDMLLVMSGSTASGELEHD
jgi:hypothetical protein